MLDHRGGGHRSLLVKIDGLRYTAWTTSREENAWKDLTGLYRPLIINWLNRQGVPARDLEDLSQDILLSVVKHLPTFQRSGNRGAFRSWLRTIVRSRTTDYWLAVNADAQ